MKTCRSRQKFLSLSTCKSRTLRGIRTFPPPLRLLTYETGHFICYEKRTFLLANDIYESAVTRPEPGIQPWRFDQRIFLQLTSAVEGLAPLATQNGPLFGMHPVEKWLSTQR